MMRLGIGCHSRTVKLSWMIKTLVLGEELFNPKVEAGGIVSFGTCSELKWQPEFTSDGWAKMPHSVVVNREQGW